jgi:flagellar hook assembly protein FlgD
VVSNNREGKLDKVYNYPNPFSTRTQFMFEHNLPNQLLDVDITIYTVTGKVVKRIHEQRISSGTRINDIAWDGRDEWGDRLGNGVYLYKITVRSAGGLQATKLEKLVILR